MVPPRFQSVSPLHSFASRVDVVPRYLSFSETVGAIWRHLTGRPRPSFREQALEQRAIERLAEEFAAEAKAADRGVG